MYIYIIKLFISLTFYYLFYEYFLHISSHSNYKVNNNSKKIILIIFAKKNLIYYRASIVISTFNRIKCLNEVIKNIYSNLPNNTELVIVDDHSIGKEYAKYYNYINKKENINVYINDHHKGAFHTKLFGFRRAKGSYIMSCDDDDLPDSLYYKEMFINIDENYDIIATKNCIYFKYNQSKISMGELISKFHNHVNMAFKKKLIMSIPYPKNVSIIRDDAPLVIPLYIISSFNKIKFYNNSYKYKLYNLCKKIYKNHRQSKQYFKKKEIRNGYDFLIEFSKIMNKTYYQKYIKNAYKHYIKIQ